jgi:hypothetical protein
VWDDLDHDGRQDAGEPGLSGVTVQLWNSAKTLLIDSAVTNASGIYTLVAPLPGNYRIRVLLPGAGDQFSPKDQAGGDDTEDSDINPAGINFGFTDIISIANNVISITSLDAGIILFRTPTPTRTPTPINLGNFVWDDLDHDGRQDAGEPGLSGITVQLWNSAKTLLIDSAVTNASGIYTLVAPLPGDYRIRVILPGAGDQFSPKDQAGGDDTEDSDINPSGINAGFTDVISIANNVISITNLDVGVLVFRTPTPTRTPTPINLGNFVWDDLDFDGQQDAGEPGLEGITVQLWNNAKTLLLDQTVTSASGIYTLVAPVPGNYRIRALLEGEYDNFSPKDQAGGDDTEDSDINPSGLNAGFTDTISIANNVISISNLDIGIITPLVLQPLPTAIIIPLVASATPSVNPLPPAPPPTPVIQRPDPNLCSGFRLTSPLDGLPNGVATFYWDPVNAQGISYRIMVMDEGRNVLTSFEAGSGTSISGDVSQGAIGGLFQLVVQVSALSNGRVVCTDERLILREAGGAPAPPIPGVPTNPPTVPTSLPPAPTNTPCPAGRQC